MNRRTAQVLAFLVGFATLIVTHGFVYGSLLGDYIGDKIASHPEVMHESTPHVMAAHALQALLVLWVFDLKAVRTARDGFQTSFVLHLGMFLMFNCFVMGLFTVFGLGEIVMDAGIAAILGGIAGGFMGAVLGRDEGEAHASS